ncbi:hypothetical protein BL250_14330 [Erwinia sp. OLTSP20]|uniref:DnaJ family domain-containing protein n=1 Tax=unclassified Erwinia TaxID=2622719 RepID=UPI000C1918BE|nr:MULTISPECIES: DnaJ family domain-containing protein [unclassified Erwinia]PIJ49123.1 hypothetical protein BV501_14185 [Erwinia sp. OAMSP11]PIJ67704.1 hypothetical protein BK416_17010 [Erwinia sp. OLSSP12]PIJ79045.1 hypothetical protein BLD47_15825 [Erwinia sp. OLCASP19]PIJ80160.1 hypothetical protein BLD46_15920 [Erwinia sp. OLMTSP26]PIJ83190.1 hypothetical protein BLD49_13550 [Erwinia sp. OLMDSP33]
MWFIDRLAEQHIIDAQRKGEFDDLPGAGRPLELDDDSQVPETLRVAYRILKNAGFLPPELQMQKEAVELSTLLRTLDPADQAYAGSLRRLRLLELKLQQAGLNTDFLRGDYGQPLRHRFDSKEN